MSEKTQKSISLKKAAKIDKAATKGNIYVEKAQAARMKNLTKRSTVRAQRKLAKREMKAVKLEGRAARSMYNTNAYASNMAKAANAKMVAAKTRERAMGSNRKVRRLEAKANRYNARQSRVAQRALKKYEKATAKGWMSSANKQVVQNSMNTVNKIISRDKERTKRVMERANSWA